ncbi:hypothetical protein Pint_27014 [Pistacia integerrima]|uniref:Uncharacterized protein n=1 Tax=Pistacia integerrima TaxID=434235 RepID=A0ACC0YRQ9_9ROSI|nr:hypothetical protein Pint_27014 [Pistacia integerrima]
MDSKLPETLGSLVRDAKAKTGSSLVPGHVLQNKHESSYGIPAEKSEGSPGVGDKMGDSKLPETFSSFLQVAKTKTGSSLIPGHLLQNKQEHSYGSPGNGERKVDSKLPKASGCSVQDAKAKTGSSLLPGHLLQIKQEISCGSPGVEEKKVDSKLLDASGSSIRMLYQKLSAASDQNYNIGKKIVMEALELERRIWNLNCLKIYAVLIRVLKRKLLALLNQVTCCKTSEEPAAHNSWFTSLHQKDMSGKKHQQKWQV